MAQLVSDLAHGTFKTVNLLLILHYIKKKKYVGIEKIEKSNVVDLAFSSFFLFLILDCAFLIYLKKMMVTYYRKTFIPV